MSAGDCGKLLLLQAELDGELDAAEAAALAAHRAECAVCAQGRAAILAARQVMQGASYHQATPELRHALAARLWGDRAPPRRPRPMPWRELASFGVGAALAAAIVLTVLPMGRHGVVAELVDDHVRALQPGHLLDVTSTNQHTVKPWFDGRLDFSPPVKDLAGEGFPLLGGRLDYLHGRAVAVLVYSRGKHLVELFVWPGSGAGGEPARADRHGYHVIHWAAGGMSLSAVSDLDPAGLEQFVREWQRSP